MRRKICVVTGSRAEYGLLRWLMQEIKDDPDLVLQTVVTGTHLSPEFGLTYRDIEADGFQIDCKVEMLLSSDSAIGVSKSMGLGVIGFADVYAKLNPDIVVVLGDRYEIFSASATAMIAKIPIAHLHGGELTEGAIDDAIRHSITKMAHLHFVAADEYRERVIQMGESPCRVHCVGGLGVDAIKKQKLLKKAELEESLRFEFGKKNLLVTYHPETLSIKRSIEAISELLAALSELKETQCLFTMTNADEGGREIWNKVMEFVVSRPEHRAYASLGQARYLSCLQFVDGVVGNSSSGIMEVPSFGKGTLNIGERQKGRIFAESVILCEADRKSIKQGLQKLYSAGFQQKLKKIKNPYGNGGASKKIVTVLKKISCENLLKKKFHAKK